MRLAIFLFFFFGLCSQVYSYNSYSGNLAWSVADTIPNDGYFYDTITVFDKETYAERTVIYRTKIEGYRYDTLIIFDPDTYEEIFKVTKVPYGSEKEKVEPESEEDLLKKKLQCYYVEWGPLKHDYVFGSANRVYVNPKMVDEILKLDIEVKSREDCDPVKSIVYMTMIVQYDNGSTDSIAVGQSADGRKKLLRSKRRAKEGTIFMLDKILIEFGDETFQLPYLQFVVKK